MFHFICSAPQTWKLGRSDWRRDSPGFVWVFPQALPSVRYRRTPPVVSSLALWSESSPAGRVVPLASGTCINKRASCCPLLSLGGLWPTQQLRKRELSKQCPPQRWPAGTGPAIPAYCGVYLPSGAHSSRNLLAHRGADHEELGLWAPQVLPRVLSHRFRG